MRSPLVSVVIPVWNSADTIATCVRALLDQSLPPDEFEVIVVDNGSSDSTPAILARYQRVRMLTETRAGSYAARNLGLAQARGRYVAFTDADCVPDPDWLAAALVRARQSDQIGIVAGPIDLLDRSATPIALAYERTFAFRQHRHVPAGYCATANWLSPRLLLEQLGGFDPDLFSGADWKLSRQIQAQGRRIVFEPAMRVGHPPRRSLSVIVEKRRRIAGGKAQSIDAGSTFVTLVAREVRDVIRKIGEAWQSEERARVKFALSVILCWIGVVSVVEMLRVLLGGHAVRR